MNEKDYKEVFGVAKYAVLLKRAVYAALRPFWNFVLKRKLSFLGGDYAYDNTDVFVKKDGGLFKSYALGVCNSLLPMKGRSVLVTGCGRGGAMLQIVARRPSYICAFDPQGYEKEWGDFKEFASEKGVRTDFFKGNFEAVPKAKFDFVVSDAVFQYIPDVDAYLKNVSDFLKEGGIFYASWGPTYFMDLNDNFGHLGKDVWEDYSQAYMGKFATEDVLRSLQKNGLKKKKIIAQVLTVDMSVIDAGLDSFNVPKLDRHCKGFYLWAVKT
jgi:SAM-dependent methyltransferase